MFISACFAQGQDGAAPLTQINLPCRIHKLNASIGQTHAPSGILKLCLTIAAPNQLKLIDYIFEALIQLYNVVQCHLRVV